MTTLHKPITILLADSNPNDRLLAQRALEECHLAHGLRFVSDGTELVDYLRRRGRYADPERAPRPALIMMDLDLPGKDGREVLREIKGDAVLRQIPVVLLASHGSAQDVSGSYDLGANSFIPKPVTYQGMVDAMQVVTRYWFEIAELPSEM